MTSPTLWGTGADGLPLYSDWKVSFTTSGKNAGKDEENNDSDSVSTQSLSSEESIHSNKSSSEGEPKEQERVFSIHRNMVGPKSKFFTKTFSGDAISTEIRLPSHLSSQAFESVVEAFELLLDYCYIADVREDSITSDNAVAMHCLCNYFEFDSEVCEMVNEFIKSDMTDETVAKYYQIVKDLRCDPSALSCFSGVLNAEPIMKKIVAMCHQSPSALESQTDLFKMADASLFLSIGASMAEDNGTTAEASKLWSENFTSFFDTYKEEDVLELKDSFRSLTAENILHEVSPKVALRLLEHERNHGLDSLTRRVKTSKGVAEEDIPRLSSNDSDEVTISTTGDSDLDVVLEEELLGTETITSLQQRCIKALCDSNWNGKENDIEQKRGELVKIMTPAVLEALLIDSVTGERALTAKMDEMTSERETETKVLKNEMETYEYKRKETDVAVANEKQKQQSLQVQLDKLREEHEGLKKSHKKSQERSVSKHAELCKANALLEAELDKEKKKSYDFDLRYRALERAQNKIETDREMYELTVKDTIKRLDAMTTNDVGGGCGLSHLVFLMDAVSDRSECSQIKKMLQQVVNDPLTYERNFLREDIADEEREEEPVDSIIGVGESSFLYD